MCKKSHIIIFSKHKSAFTQLDLMFTLLSVLFLIFLSITIYSNTHKNSDEHKCMLNIRRILIGIENYKELHIEYPASASLLKPLTNDWIYWQPTRRLEHSPAVALINRSDLVCPLDNGSRHRQYPFSYTMNIIFSGIKYLNYNIEPQMIVILEEENPDDGEFDPSALNIYALRHRHRVLVGRADGAVDALTAHQARERLKRNPVPLKPEIPLR
jgi:hypothetical protein